MSMNLATAVIAGNLANPPAIRHLPSGTASCTFSVAVRRGWTDKQTNERKSATSFIDIETFAGLAERCHQYLSQGSAVVVDGELIQQKWQDKQTGQNRSALLVRARNVHFADQPGRASNENDADFEVPF